MGAKQKRMKQQVSAPSRISIPPSVYRPDRVRSLLFATKLELERFHGRELTFDELGRFAGQAASTAFDKLQKSKHPQVEALLGWLERLPEAVRSELLAGTCRCFTSLEHPKLSHNPVQVSMLKELLRQPSGLTVVTGGNEWLRAFVLSALGQSSLRLGPASRMVAGIDKLLPDWFVPVDGITYLNTPAGESPARDLVVSIWRTMQDANKKLVLLNGVVAALDDSHTQIFALSRKCSVFVSDAETIVQPLLVRKDLPALRRLTVSPWQKDYVQVALGTL